MYKRQSKNTAVRYFICIDIRVLHNSGYEYKSCHQTYNYCIPESTCGGNKCLTYRVSGLCGCRCDRSGTHTRFIGEQTSRNTETHCHQDTGTNLTILDFGCGKSYLTFAMYYYLHELKGYDIRIIGLDLKREVIIHCNELAEKYGYQKLKFLVGDIADYTGVDRVDMVVTLHACDTATDFALAKAVGWNAKVILSVPCCQHELNRQIQSDVLAPVLKYGLIRERMAALVTDALRAEYLEREGYDVQILEFIDMEHTPKNILIRAVQNGKCGENQESIKKCEEFLHVSPTLKRLLDHKGEV